jgi:hypothetical protein
MNKTLLVPPLVGVAIMILPVASCRPPIPDIPALPPRAYRIDIQLPPEDELHDTGLFTLRMERGSSLTLPATVTSESDIPISIRLALYSNNTIPDFVTFETQQEFVTIEPREITDIPATFTIAESAAPGSYRMGISGELEMPIEGRATAGQSFNLIITADQS